jgi:hypothetical protein
VLHTKRKRMCTAWLTRIKRLLTSEFNKLNSEKKEDKS